MSDVIRFQCPACQNRLKVAENMAGVTVGCSYCAAAVIVPEPVPASSLPMAEADDEPPVVLHRPAPVPPQRPRRSPLEFDTDDGVPIRSRSRPRGGGSAGAVLLVLLLAGGAAVALFACLSRGSAPEEKIRVAVYLCFGLLFYFIPTIVAILRRHPNTASIVVANFFLGWSLVGFVVSLAWAFTNNAAPVHEHRHYHD